MLVKKSMILLSGLSCLIGIVFNCVAMGTNSWVVATSCSVSTQRSTSCGTNATKLDVNYGLFNGWKYIDTGISPTPYKLKVFCPSGEGVCLWSCGKDEGERKSEFNYARNLTPYNCSSTRPRSADSIVVESSDGATADNNKFMQYGYWVATIIFLALTLAFQLAAAGLSVLNSLETVPIEQWLGPMGIYLTNGTAGLMALITLSLWGDLFNRGLSKELAVQETVIGNWSTNSHLGYSYWLVFGSLLMAVTSCILNRFRNVPQKRLNKTQGAVNDESTPRNGAILLY